MDSYSARVEAFPGRERTLASVLQGMGFNVFRIDGDFTVEAPTAIWRDVFGDIDTQNREITVPASLADMVTRVVLLRSLSQPESK